LVESAGFAWFNNFSLQFNYFCVPAFTAASMKPAVDHLVSLAGASWLLLGAMGCATQSNSFDDSFAQPLARVWFNSTQQSVQAYYADTAEEHAVGLGQIDQLSDTEAMVFNFTKQPEQPNFWMKDVDYPIDIIWIRGNRISGITANVQPEPATMSLDDYPVYRAPGEVDWVVEVPAGYAANHYLVVGDTFFFDCPTNECI
jgi:uncharacterized membrane protein (UPF0127 family)